MRIQVAVPDRYIDADVLGAGLELATRANERMLQDGYPGAVDAIRSGLKWRPERFHDGEHFDLVNETLKRGWGDCDDLAPHRAAELRVTGEDTQARAIAVRSGKDKWHAVVERTDGTIEDPSRWAGMGRSSISGPAVPLMAEPGYGALAVVPYRGGYAARCDLPWQESGHAFSVQGRADTPREAAAAALRRAYMIGHVSGAANPEHMRRAQAIDVALCGGDVDAVQLHLLERGCSEVMPADFIRQVVREFPGTHAALLRF